MMTTWIMVAIFWLVVFGMFLLTVAAIATGQEGWLVWVLLSTVGLLSALYWTFAIARRRKNGLRKGEELLSHLKNVGISATWAEKGAKEFGVGVSDILGRRNEALIRIQGKNFDFISLMSEITNGKFTRENGKFNWEGGVDYYFDYLVSDPNTKRARRLKLGGGFFIIPEAKHGYVKIRTPDTLLSAENLEKLDEVAGRIKSQTI